MRLVATLCRELNADRRHDGELLAAFLTGPSEEAFTELIRRHGPLVWSACRRFLPDPADAEDAFQAAFLVLVRRSRRLTGAADLGPWLYRVAVWTARNVRRKNARRLARQTDLPDAVADPNSRDSDLKADLDAALLGLPTRYRDSIVLCHLRGFTRREAAERLGCPEGTLSAWLSRGLEKLRHRLRGLDPAKVLGVPAVAVPAILVANTARAAVASTVAAATVPPAVTSIVEGVLHMFWVKKATAATVAMFAVFTLGVGIGVGTRTEYAGAIAGDGPMPAVTSAPGTADPNLEVKAELIRLQKQLADAEKLLEKQKAEAAVAGKQLQRALDLGDKKATAEARVALARLEAACEEAEKECQRLRNLIKLTEAKLAPPKPAASDLAKEIAELEAQIQLLRVKRETDLEAVAAAKQRVEKLKKTIGEDAERQRKEAEKALSQFQEKADTDALKLELLKIKLEQLKAKAKAEEKPAKPEPPKMLSLNDFFGKPAELEEQLRLAQVQAEKAQVVALVHAQRAAVLAERNGDPKAIEAAKAATEQAAADAEAARHQVELTRHKIAAAKAAQAPPLKALGACIEVVVIGGGKDASACRVREYGLEGKFLGSVIAEDAKALELIMTRAMKDSGGPRDLWLTVSHEQSPDAILQAVEACKKAGYTKVSINGTLPQGLKLPLAEK